MTGGFRSVNPYLLNYGSYNAYRGYGNLGSVRSYGSIASSRTASNRSHQLTINDNDSERVKQMKTAINRVNAAGDMPQNARGVTKQTDSESESGERLSSRVSSRKMSADDIRDLYYMMSGAFGGFGGYGYGGLF